MQETSGKKWNVNPENRKRRKFLFIFVVIFLVLLSAFIVLNYTVFRIQTITIKGNRTVGKDEIADLAGLQNVGSILFVNSNAIQEKVSQDSRLEFISLEKEYPNRLILTVSEKTVCTYARISNRYYWMDERGTILKIEEYAPDFIQVSGLKIRRAETGAVISLSSEKQYTAFTIVLSEMKLQNCCDQFQELNLIDTEKLLLSTEDGYTISLGDSSEIRAKLLTLRGVLRHLRENGYSPGALDVSVPGYATYTPPE